MEFSTRINKWLISIKKYIVFYKDGYYIIPYLSNSPDVMINSLKRMPFTKHNPDEKAIYSHNIFTDGVLYYRELTDGLWLIITEIKFLKDVCTKALYDGEASDYYFLSHLSFKVQVDENNINEVKVPKVGWTLYKPGHEATAYYNKGTDGIFTNIIFTKTWAEKHIPIEHFNSPSSLKSYFDSNKTLMLWENLVPEASEIVYNLLNILKSKTPESTNHLSLNMLCLTLVTKFIDATTKTQPIYTLDNSLTAMDLKYLAKSEKMLMNCLTTAFPTINVIAKEIHTSPTKLKQDFKVLYGKPIFQYYQEKQMQLALELLKTKKHTVKEISFKLGYDNPSNFTAAFKKVYNTLPSEVV